MMTSSSLQFLLILPFQYSFHTKSLSAPPLKPHNNLQRPFKNPSFPPQCSSLSSSQNHANSTTLPKPPAEKLSNSFLFPSMDSLFDPNLLSSLLQSCSAVKEINAIHSIVLKGLGRSELFVNNNLISVYAKFGKLKHAKKVFDEMPERNVVSWTAMLNGFSKSGSLTEFWGLFDEMVENCVQSNASTYVCILNMCGRYSHFKLGEQIHACIVKGMLSNLIVDSALVSFYAQCGDLSATKDVFERMLEQDVVSWTSVIAACAQLGHGKEALSLFARMWIEGIGPNEFTVCSTLNACGEEEDLKFGIQLHGAIVKKAFKEDVFVGSSLVDMYVKCGQVSDARVLFDKMPRRNTVTWTLMIAGYVQNGDGKEAISLFQRMKRRRIFANEFTVVSVLSACGMVRSLYEGKEVHAQILKNSIEQNMYIGSTLVWFYCKFGEYEYAGNVLQSMPSRDVVSWTAMISGHARHGYGLEAFKFLHNMLGEGVEPNPYTYSAALKACAKQEAMKQGTWIHAFVNKTNALSNVYVGSALIDMYLRCGCFDDAFRVFDRMPERNSVSWKVMITGYAKNGRCQEALQLMYLMQKEGFEVDDYILSTVLNACGGVEREMEPLSTCFLQS